MNIVKRYITKNDCYNTNRKITPVGIMVHSTATPGVMAAAFAERWDQAGIEKATHFFVDNTEAINILPCEVGSVHRAWHCGSGKNGSGNDTMIAFEICESKDLDDKAYFAAAYNNAVELTVYLCQKFGILPQNVICHSEGYQAGIASNHADVMHWFPRHGVDMDDFRQAVADKLSAPAGGQDKADTGADEAPAANTLYRVQVGAFAVKENAEKMQQKLRADGYDTIIKVVSSLYKVQTGAFSIKENAEKMKEQLEAAGYPTYMAESAVTITNQTADVAYAEWPAICNEPNTNVRTGPGTSNGILDDWPKLGVGNEVDVIGEGIAANGKLWYQILIANQYTGWVFGEYLSKR